MTTMTMTMTVTVVARSSTRVYLRSSGCRSATAFRPQEECSFRRRHRFGSLETVQQKQQKQKQQQSQQLQQQQQKQQHVQSLVFQPRRQSQTWAPAAIRWGRSSSRSYSSSSKKHQPAFQHLLSPQKNRVQSSPPWLCSVSQYYYSSSKSSSSFSTSTTRTTTIMAVEENKDHRDGTTGATATATTNTNALYLPSLPNVPIRHVVAPMVAASDYAFRCLCRQYADARGGNLLTFTQMLHARNLLNDKTFLKNHWDLYEYLSESDRFMGGVDLLQRSSSKSNNNSKNKMLATQSQKACLGDYYNDYYNNNNHDDNNNRLVLLPDEWKPYTTGPVIVQLAGNDPDQVVAAALLILERTTRLAMASSSSAAAAAAATNSATVAGFDLNCGCPQGIARKGRYGAFLMEQDNAETVCHILSALRKALPAHIAVSAKIRLPSLTCTTTGLELAPDDPMYQRIWKDRMHRLMDTGIDFLTIHGRTLRENKTTVGACRFNGIRTAVQIAQDYKPHFPVIANGGIETAMDIPRVLQWTNAVAVMSSEALLESPTLFAKKNPSSSSSSSSLSPRQLLEQQFAVTRDYLHWCRLYPPVPGVLGSTGGSFNVVRGHLFKFLHRYLQEQVDLRNLLGCSVERKKQDRMTTTTMTKRQLDIANDSIMTLPQAEQFVDALYARYADLSDDELASKRSALPQSSWYRRHWEGNALVQRNKNITQLSESNSNDSLLSTSASVGMISSSSSSSLANATNDLAVGTVDSRSIASNGTPLAASTSVDQRKELIRQRLTKLKLEKKKREGSLLGF